MPDPDPAATVLLLRESSPGFDVLMVQRNSRGSFAELLVFPGGGVAACDVPAGGSAGDDEAHRRAAVRELAEETGIVVTTDGPRSAPGVKGAEFYGWLHDRGVEPDTGSLTLVSRWVTPKTAPRRFDTRFYLIGCDHIPDVVIDTEELTGFEWLSPRTALRRYEAGDLKMILPTLAHLRWLSLRSSITDALASARGADGRTLIQPRRMDDGSLLPIHLPAEAQ